MHGQVIPAGKLVLPMIGSANRDPKQFRDAGRFDITREPNQHVAFGHGIHQCLGQQLARIEMRIGYAALLRRLPALQLVIELKDVRMCNDMMVYGVHELPIAWEAT